MYHLLRYSFTPKKVPFPTSQQLILSSYTIKGKLGCSTYLPTLPTSRRLISTSSTNGTDQVSDMLDEFLENCVYKDKRSAFKLLREVEKKNFNLEIAKKDKDHEIELAKKDNELAVAAIKTGHLNLNYLRLKGAVHLRGVFEQWELFNLGSIEGNRGTKWTKYFSTHKNVLEVFKNFWPNPNEIDTNRVVTEMKSFYKWLSERIHNAHAVGDYVEWRRNTLTPVQNKVTEYMCRELNIDYRIIEASESFGKEIVLTTGEVTQTNTNNIGDLAQFVP
ncbi:unnamed protein product [Rhizophagus irregularis]|uniref:Uncharacterized protein n=1 Tax=Rhizophagus irregularis TaxID=588596 RepID=A0A2I1G1I7_9GLOM|nr:hypothetical protein RhiirA4_394746 [Rhizophagus irregularis]CAB4434208.1 unnamed protein product [Rhizophagus irregularis]